MKTSLEKLDDEFYLDIAINDDELVFIEENVMVSTQVFMLGKVFNIGIKLRQPEEFDENE